MMTALDDLAHKLGLLQTPPRDTAKEWASRCRELVKDGTTLDQAAIIAAKNIFTAEFKPTHYKHTGSIEMLIGEIERFVSQEESTSKKVVTWRVAFFTNSDDNVPSRYTTIEAPDEDAAVDEAVALMGGREMRVDVHRTFVKK
jgi:hypothetical protein